MDQMISAYEQKYSESNRILAQNALTYFADIDFDVPVKLANENLAWRKMEAGLKEATVKRETIFNYARTRKRNKGKGL
jgi:hypothetical protein